MLNKKSLAGKTVIVTRPLAQAQYICTELERCQATVVHFPVISVTVAKNIDAAKNTLADLNTYNTIIFISANAVHYAMSLVKDLNLNLNKIQLAAIGPATKSAIETYGHKIDIFPQHNFTSEALLTHPLLQNIDGGKVLVIRGRGGREHLREELELRGARVDYAEVYQRQIPKQRNTINLSALPKSSTAILIYSTESLQNLWSLCNAEEQEWIKNVVLILGGQRISDSADSVGLAKNSIIAENPSDKAMLKVLWCWAQ